MNKTEKESLNKPEISVIVPVHNTEKYLAECLDSILNQTFTDIEVICIDDKSNDSSLDILREYEQKDSRIRVFKNEINKGLGYTRNLGIELAEGKYINFVDSDDYIPPHAYERLYEYIELNDTDFVIGNVSQFNENLIWKEFLFKTIFENIPESIPKTHISKNISLVYDTISVNKIIRRSFLKKYEIRFPEDGLLYEDIPFSMKLHCFSSSISILNEEIYFWRVRADSSSITQQVDQRQMKNFNDRIKIIKMIENIMDENDVSNNIRYLEYFKWLEHDLKLFIRQINEYSIENQNIIIDEVIQILKLIPNKIRNDLDSYYQIIYKMIENRDLDSLLYFIEQRKVIYRKPEIVRNLKEEYQACADFENDAKKKNLIANLYDYRISNKEFLEIYITCYLPYLDNASSELEFKLIKPRNEDFDSNSAYNDLYDYVNMENYAEICDIPFQTTEFENVFKLDVPVEYVKNSDERLNILVIYKNKGIVKEKLVRTYRRNALKLDKYNIRLDYGINHVLFLSYRQIVDKIQITQVTSIKDDKTNKIKSFILVGHSETVISEIEMENFISFKKFRYPAKNQHIIGTDFVFEIEIPLKDILNSPVTKWILKSDDLLLNINDSKNFSYNHEKIDFENVFDEMRIAYILTEKPPIYKTQDKTKNKAQKDNSKSRFREIIDSLEESYNEHLDEHYVEIKEEDNEIIFNVKGAKLFKKFLIIKHRDSGKRILKAVKNSKAKLNFNELNQLDEFGKYDIYLKTKNSKKTFSSRTRFVKQNGGKKLIDFKNQRIFEAYQTFYRNLSFNYKKEIFLAELLSVSQNNGTTEIKGNIRLLKDIEFDGIELVLHSKNQKIKLSCEYEKNDALIKFKAPVDLELDENCFNPLYKAKIRLIDNDFILGETPLKSKKSLLDVHKKDFEKTSNIFMLIFTNDIMNVMIKIANEDSYKKIRDVLK